jgi:hypothetical protein
MLSCCLPCIDCDFCMFDSSLCRTMVRTRNVQVDAVLFRFKTSVS